MSGDIRESAVRFGPHNGLAGIFSTARHPRQGAPHVVIVNAGIVHRVGPNRLYVEIARTLTAQGFPVLRFDLSGLGDSESSTRNVSLAETVREDIREALDYLERTASAKQFVMLGLCAGANHSLASAIVEPRIVGAVLIDPSVTRTLRSKVVHFARRLRHVATLRELLSLRHPIWRRSLARLRITAVSDAARGQGALPEKTMPVLVAELTVGMQHVVDRGVQLMIAFTGGVNHLYNYYGQIFDLLPNVNFRDQLRLHFLPETDHAIADAPSRAKLLHLVSAWFIESFPVDCPSPGDSPEIEEFELI